MTAKSNSSVTLLDVAQSAQVSKVTASRALTGRGYVAAATKERVEAAAKRLGYRPNPLVQTLMSGVRRKRIEQSVNLGWLEGFLPSMDTPPPYRMMRAGAMSRAQELGYSLVPLPPPNSSSSREQLRKTWFHQGIRGIVVGPRRDPDEVLPLPYADFSFVTLGAFQGSEQVHGVRPDYAQSMKLALDVLQRQGLRRRGFLHWPFLDRQMEHAALMVFEHDCLQRGEALDKACASYEGWKPRDYKRWADRYRPEVIIGDSVMLYDYLIEAGVLGRPDCPLFVTLTHRDSHPHCSGAHKPFEKLGSAAIDMLSAHVQRNERGLPTHPKTMMLAGSWQEASTFAAG